MKLERLNRTLTCPRCLFRKVRVKNNVTEASTAVVASDDAVPMERAAVVVEEVEVVAPLQEEPLLASTAESIPAQVSEPKFSEYALVNVQSRTWRGINKPGGVGRVKKVLFIEPIPRKPSVDDGDEEEVDEYPNGHWVYNIRYVVEGSEKRVEEKYIELYIDNVGSRDVKGRCR